MWATAVTLVLPAALVLVAATTILGGGFRGLGAVGQVFTGPEVPEASLVHAPAAPDAKKKPLALGSTTEHSNTTVIPEASFRRPQRLLGKGARRCPNLSP